MEHGQPQVVLVEHRVGRAAKFNTTMLVHLVGPIYGLKMPTLVLIVMARLRKPSASTTPTPTHRTMNACRLIGRRRLILAPLGCRRPGLALGEIWSFLQD